MDEKWRLSSKAEIALNNIKSSKNTVQIVEPACTAASPVHKSTDALQMAAPTRIEALPKRSSTDLSNADLLPRARLRRRKSAIVFDWDSTIMPT
eukprot:IDg10611t1